jgi:LPXTG-motif cell wall-anchored protein
MESSTEGDPTIIIIIAVIALLVLSIGGFLFVRKFKQDNDARLKDL